MTESDRLCVQVNAYLDNKIDVGSLLEDSDTKNAALEQVAELEEALSHVRRFTHIHVINTASVLRLFIWTNCPYEILHMTLIYNIY